MAKLPCVFFLLVFPFVYGQTIADEKIISDARAITKQLCSKDFHGRGYVDGGDSLAAQYIAGQFKKIGLKKRGKSYFQPFQFAVNHFPGAMEVKVNGKVLQPGIDYLVDPESSGGRASLRPRILATEEALNDTELKKILREIDASSTYNSIAINEVNLSSDTLKKISAIERMLADFYPVIVLTDKKFTWSVAQEQAKNPFIRMQASSFAEDCTIDVHIVAKLKTNHQARNVIASLPAKKKTNKTIVFTAHYDHLGQMGSATYFPGGNDNASGTAMLLSLANFFKQFRPNVNLLFIAFAGEEIGLMGSKYFTEHPLIQLNEIDFLINLDIMGSGEEGITLVNATLFDREFQLMKTINDEKKLLPQIKSRGPAANSDHYWFTEKGVPAFFIYTMGPNKNYHDINDTYENLSFEKFDEIHALLIEFVTRKMDVK